MIDRDKWAKVLKHRRTHFTLDRDYANLCKTQFNMWVAGVSIRRIHLLGVAFRQRMLERKKS